MWRTGRPVLHRRIPFFHPKEESHSNVLKDTGTPRTGWVSQAIIKHGGSPCPPCHLLGTRKRPSPIPAPVDFPGSSLPAFAVALALWKKSCWQDLGLLFTLASLPSRYPVLCLQG
ncbi:hypothetical protein CapIbe_019260 [Capra ibex]